MTDTSPPDFTQMDDSALLSTREQMRTELQRLPPNSARHAALAALCDASLDELVDRARLAWTRPGKGEPMDHMTRARLLVGVDLLLADPEELGNDALEGDLYILRDKLSGAADTQAGTP
jgi:hypothetical protein